MHRVQKVIADTGLCSRRKAEELIVQGRVKKNGAVVKIGDNADPQKDTITVNNKPLPQAKKIYILLHKPKGYLSTTKPEKGKRPVTDLIDVKERIYPVGRLDFDTEGLLLLTNDGDFTQRITHPSFGVEKTYEVSLSKKIHHEQLAQLASGVVIDKRRVDISSVRVMQPKVVEITIHEGRKHIVKKIFGKMKLHITLLKRVRVGSLGLGKLKKGTWRTLSSSEVARLLKSARKSE